MTTPTVGRRACVGLEPTGCFGPRISFVLSGAVEAGFGDVRFGEKSASECHFVLEMLSRCLTPSSSGQEDTCNEPSAVCWWARTS